MLGPNSTDAYVRAMFGERARHVPAWMWIQDGGDGTVSFVGSSRVTEPAHPLRYGSRRTHQFVVGELIVRPTRIVLATDAHTGDGLAHLVTQVPWESDFRAPDGEVLWVSRHGVPTELGH